MPRVVRVSFRQAGRLYQFDARDLDLSPGDRVVAETSRGRELGTVRTEPVEIPNDEAAAGLKRIARKATESDLRKLAGNAAREQQAMEIAAKKIAEHGLSMKLIAAEKVLEGNHIVLHFTAENRVDFRALVRDLARALRSRIELHQVGVRDEAKLLGGIGPCGRVLCCATFMTEFDPVGIKMAKEQDLSLSPQKISGACGRLMCCLNFEYEFYREQKRGLPKIGSRVETDQGPGKLAAINVLSNRAVVSLEGGLRVEVPLATISGEKSGDSAGSSGWSGEGEGEELAESEETEKER